jgi:hypothetical protein
VLFALLGGAARAEDGPNSDASPILVATDRQYAANPFGDYLAEILRGEGLMEFATTDRATLGAGTDGAERLATRRVVVLAQMRLEPAAQSALREFVRAGGLLVAMRPEAELADVFGIRVEGTVPEQLLQYFAVAPELPEGMSPGLGITASSLQYHGEAIRYSLEGARSLACLSKDAETPSPNPAVTLHEFGKGRAVAFAFDLAKSVVLMRQGNPDWQNSEGDGMPQYRPMDMFFRADGRRYCDAARMSIPQADEAQRLLANLVLTLSDRPLPRMWYLPKMHKVILINTGDAEDMAETQIDPVLDTCAKYGGRFSVYLRNGPPHRGIERTSVEKEAAWRKAGHEVGVHVWAGGKDGEGAAEALDQAFGKIVGDLEKKFGHRSRTVRSHTIDWTGWVDMAAIEAKHGTGMDMNYYHYIKSASPVDAYGYFNGTGMPQRFIDAQGQLLPIYQATTEWPDEWFADSKLTVDQTVGVMKKMFEAAEAGYYSAMVNNIHPPRYNGSDKITPEWPTVIWKYCQEKGIPSWSGAMLLDFVEARNATRFENLVWRVAPDGHESELAFTFRAPLPGQDLTVMIPAQWSGRTLAAVTADGKPVDVKTDRIKGLAYGMFTTGAAQCEVVARYEKR